MKTSITQRSASDIRRDMLAMETQLQDHVPAGQRLKGDDLATAVLETAQKAGTSKCVEPLVSIYLTLRELWEARRANGSAVLVVT